MISDDPWQPTTTEAVMIERCKYIFNDLGLDKRARKQLAEWKVRQYHKYNRARCGSFKLIPRHLPCDKY